MNTTAYAVARTYLGTEEMEGPESNPAILAMLREVAPWPNGDEVAWCSAFANHIARLLGLQRSKSLAARSWLRVGKPIELFEARPENDVVILKRNGGPGPEVMDAPGHVGFFAGRSPGEVHVLGGNQHDAVTVARFPSADILGVRRLT